MAIRTKKYKAADTDLEVRAIEITTKNHVEVMNWINRNGGEADASVFVTKDGDELDHKIQINQLNRGKNWIKRGWRVARVGDYVVRTATEFFRVKAVDFPKEYVLVK